jgi:MazG family protein
MSSPGTPSPRGSRLPELVAIMDRLLAPDGCPWDREQTLASLRPFLLEETYEVLDALEHDDVAGHREELGDLLMQIVFHAAIRRAEAAFDIDDVIAGIADKLVRRHPHVFAETAGVDTADKVLAQWDQIKAAEKAAAADAKPGAAGPKRQLAGIPRGLPALVRAQKLGSRAGKVGFDWPGYEGSLAKVREEVDEVAETAAAGDHAAAQRELGDLLFAVVNLARKLHVDPETALHDACAKFTRRFEFIEDRLADAGRVPTDADLDELDGLWNRAKAAEPPPGATAVAATPRGGTIAKS